jgi:release factor glutamine methyltransferase
MNALAAVREVERELAAAGVDSPRADAELLLAHVTQLSRSALYSADRELEEPEASRLRSLVERRRKREPLAYILGSWGFRRLTLAIDARALVPRPETEVVVERCLAHLGALPAPRVLDVGTGSGAIALAVADEHPGAQVLATDISSDALALARENRHRLGLEGRVELVLGHLDAHLPGPFDLVVSNPPYVEPKDEEQLEPEIRLYEPREAVVGVGAHPAIARRARELLGTDGWLVFECGDEQGESVASLLRSLGYEDVAATQDLTGRERVVEGRRGWGGVA